MEGWSLSYCLGCIVEGILKRRVVRAHLEVFLWVIWVSLSACCQLACHIGFYLLPHFLHLTEPSGKDT